MMRSITQNRVAVTGLGAITALGANVADTWKNLLGGLTGIRPLPRFEHRGFATSLAAAIQTIDWTSHFSSRRLRRLDPCHRLAIVAVREALEDSKFVAGNV